MPIDEKSVQELYNILSRRKVIEGQNYQTFSQNFNDPEKAKATFNSLPQVLKPSYDFDKWYGLYGGSVNQPVPTTNATKEIPDNTGIATVSQSDLQQEPEANQPVNLIPPGWGQQAEVQTQEQQAEPQNVWKPVVADIIDTFTREHNAKVLNPNSLQPEEEAGTFPLETSQHPPQKIQLGVPKKEGKSIFIPDDNFYKLSRNYAYQYSKEGNYAESDNILKQLINENPNDDYLLQLESYNRKKQGDNKGAFESINTAIALAEKNDDVRPELYLNRASIGVDANQKITAYMDAERYIKSHGGVSGDNEQLAKNLTEAYRVKALISGEEKDKKEYLNNLANAKKLTNQRQTAERNANLISLVDSFLTKPETGLGILFAPIAGLDQAINKIKEGVTGQGEIIRQVEPGVTEKEIEELSPSTRAVLITAGLIHGGFALAGYTPSMMAFNAGINTVSNAAGEENVNKVMAPFSSSINPTDWTKLSRTEQETVAGMDLMMFMVFMGAAHEIANINTGGGGMGRAKMIAGRVGILYDKVIKNEPLTEAENAEAKEMASNAPPETVETYVTQVQPKIKTEKQKSNESPEETQSKEAEAQTEPAKQETVQASEEQKPEEVDVLSVLEGQKETEPTTKPDIKEIVSDLLYNEQSRIEQDRKDRPRKNDFDRQKKKIGIQNLLMEWHRMDNPTVADAEMFIKKAGLEVPKDIADLPKTETEHANTIKEKFRTTFKEKGIPEEQIEGAVALMDTRAKSWASEEKGRTPEQWYQGISDIKQGEFKKGTLKAYQILGEIGASNIEGTMDNLKVAKEMESKGKESKDIRIATGWEKGVDGKWRYEIDDSMTYLYKSLQDYVKDAKKEYGEDVFNNGQAVQKELKFLYSNPELYQAYPELMDVLVSIEKLPPDEVAFSDGEHLVLNSNYNLSKSETKSIIIHEIQHLIQSKEGFARGSGIREQRERQARAIYNKPYSELSDFQRYTIEPQAKGEYEAIAGEVEARNVSQRMGFSPQERIQKTLESTEDITRDQQTIIQDLLLQKNKGEIKGAVEILADGKKVIHAMQSPDFSTMVHEIAHVFEGDLTKVEQKIVKDFGGSEKFARGFERYLRDGKAPTTELKALFDKFKQWLTDIYSKLKGSPIEGKITPEIKDIFDRLLKEKEPLTESGVNEAEKKTPVGETVEAEPTSIEEAPVSKTEVIEKAVESSQSVVPLKEQKRTFLQDINNILDIAMGKLKKNYEDNPEIAKNVHFSSWFEGGEKDAIQRIKDAGYDIDNNGIIHFDIKGDGEFRLSLNNLDVSKTKVERYFPESEKQLADQKPSVPSNRYSQPSNNMYFYDVALSRGSLEASESAVKMAEDNLAEAIKAKNTALASTFKTEIERQKKILSQAEKIDFEVVNNKKLQSLPQITIGNRDYSKRDILDVHKEFGIEVKDEKTTKEVLLAKEVKENKGLDEYRKELNKRIKQNEEDFNKSFPMKKTGQRKIPKTRAEYSEWNRIERTTREAESKLSELKANEKAIRNLTEPDKVIEALDKLKINTKGKLYDAQLGIPVALWNGSIDAIKLGYKGGKLVVEAIEDGIKYLKEQGHKFDEQKYRDYWLNLLPKDANTEQPPVSEPPSNKEIDALDGMKERQHYTKIQESDLPQEIKEGLKDNETARFYVPQAVDVSEAEAKAIVQSKGLVASEEMVKDKNNDLHPATRIKLIQQVRDGYNNLWKENYQKDVTKGDYYFDKTESMLEFEAQQGTIAGQTLKAFDKLLTPEYEVYKIRKATRKQLEEKVKQNQQEIDEKAKIIRDLTEKAAKQITDKPNKAIDDAVKKVKPKEGRKFVPKELIEKERQYRDKLLSGFKKSDLFNVSAGGLNPKAIELVGNLTASYVREGFYRASDVALKIADTFKKKYGVDVDPKEIELAIPDMVEGKSWDEILQVKQAEEKSENAEKLAKRILGRVKGGKPAKFNPVKEMMDTLFGKVDEKLPKKENKGKKSDLEKITEAINNKSEYADTWRESKEVVDKLIDNLQVDETTKEGMREELQGYYDEIIGEPFSEKQVSGAVKQGLKEMDVQIRNIIREHYSVVDATKKSLAEKLVEQTGLKGEDAKLLSNAVQREMDNLTFKAKQDAIKAATKVVTKVKNKPSTIKRTHDAIVELSNLGAFSDAEFRKIYAEKMGWPELTQEQAMEIERLAQRVQDAKPGSPKWKAIQDLQKYEKNLPGIDWGEVGTSFWYANMLSGYTTQERNIFGNVSHYMLEATNMAIEDPKMIPFIIKATFEGHYQGMLTGRDVWRTGYTPFRGKYTGMPSAERWNFTGGKFNPANYHKYAGRFLYAMDAVSYEGAKALKAYQLAKVEANKQGIKSFGYSQGKFDFYKNIWAEVDKQLNNTQDAFDNAYDVATQEGLKGLDRKLRVFELMEQGRSKDIIEKSHDFASRLTYNHPTEGTLGVVTDFVGRLSDKGMNIPIPYTGKHLTIKPVKFIVPFTTIVSNVANVAVDYSPYGFYRGAKGGIGLKSQGNKYRAFTPEERINAFRKASIGIAAQVALYFLTEPDDKGKSAIEITANGTGNWAKNKLLYEQGWRPYSIKIGNTWYSYQYTPLLLALAPLAFVRDAQKYDEKYDERTTLENFGYAMGRVPSVFSDMTFLSSVSNLMTALTSIDPKDMDKFFQKMESLPKSFVVPNLYSTTVQGLEEIFKVPQKETKGVLEKLYMDVPYARDRLNTLVNVFGEPIIPHKEVIMSDVKSNPEFDFLVKNKLWIKKPKQESQDMYLLDTEKKAYIPMTNDEFFKFSVLRGKYIKQGITSLMKDSPNIEKELKGNIEKESMTEKGKEKEFDIIYHKRLNEEKSNIVSEATLKAKEELFKGRIGIKSDGIKRDLFINRQNESIQE